MLPKCLVNGWSSGCRQITGWPESFARGLSYQVGEMGIREVREVGLVIGKAKAVPLLMEKAFQIIRMKHPMCREASLHLDVREIRMQCAACGTEFEVEDVMGDFRCPECDSEDCQMISGNELMVDYFIPNDVQSNE